VINEKAIKNMKEFDKRKRRVKSMKESDKRKSHREYKRM
jgi:hypothetical protein